MEKKFFLVLASLLFGLNSFAQDDVVLATFETEGSDLIVYDTPWYEASFYDAQPGFMNNPLTNGLNTSSKCFGMVKKDNTGWWGAWSFFNLKTPITITENNKYLKVMVNRSSEAGGTTFGWNTNDSQWLSPLKPRKYGVWEDLVLDLSNKMGQTLTVLVLLHHDWDGQALPQATLLYDNIILSADPLPRGATLMDGTGFALYFEEQSELDKWKLAVNVVEKEKNSYLIVNNPYSGDELNGSSKVMQFEKGDVAWWQGGPQFELDGLIKLGEDTGLQYLHVAAAVPGTAFDASGMCTIQTSAWDHLGKESETKHLLFEGQENMWNDLVFNLTEELNYLQKFAVRFDVRKDANDEWINSPIGTFYLDAISIDNQENVRDVITGIKRQETANANLKIVDNASDRVRIIASGDATIEIGTMNGALVKKVSVSNGDVIHAYTLPAGIYYVKATGTGVKPSVDKLIVR